MMIKYPIHKVAKDFKKGSKELPSKEIMDIHKLLQFAILFPAQPQQLHDFLSWFLMHVYIFFHNLRPTEPHILLLFPSAI